MLMGRAPAATAARKARAKRLIALMGSAEPDEEAVAVFRRAGDEILQQREVVRDVVVDLFGAAGVVVLAAIDAEGAHAREVDAAQKLIDRQRRQEAREGRRGGGL